MTNGTEASDLKVRSCGKCYHQRFGLSMIKNFRFLLLHSIFLMVGKYFLSTFFLEIFVSLRLILYLKVSELELISYLL